MDYLEKIHILLKRNKDMMTESELIKSDIDNKIAENTDNYSGNDVKFFKEQVSKLKIIEKKIKDNVSTIRDLSSRTKLDNQYYVDAVNNFLKRASHKSDDILTEIASDSQVNATIEFTNAGTFFSWTDDKNIKLIIQFKDVSDIIQVQEEFPLIITDDINVPGNEDVSEDFGKAKIFDVSFTSPSIIGDYILTLMISDDTHIFLDTYEKNVKII